MDSHDAECVVRDHLAVGHADVGKPSLADLIGSVDLVQKVVGDGIATVQLWPKASEVLYLDRLWISLPVRELELDD